MTILRLYVVPNTLITLPSVLLHGSPSPAATEMTDRQTEGHCPSDIGVLHTGLSLASLVLSLSPFKSSVKLFQWALLTPVQRCLSPCETGVPHMLPAGLVSRRPTMIKTLKILPVTPDWEPGIDLLGLPVSSLVTPCSWKDRAEHCLCSWSPDQLSSGPEVSLDCPWTSCSNFLAAYLKNQ